MPNNKKLVIVDADSWFSGKLKESIMAALPGTTVLTALDAYSGLQMIRDSVPDLVVFDATMSKMSGIELFKQISALDKSHTIAFLVVTGRKELEEVFDSMGVQGFLVKDTSLKFEHIVREAERILAGHSKPNVFIVDDGQKPTTKNLYHILKVLGFRVSVTQDINEFIRHAREWLPDFVVIEFEPNGGEMLKKIRSTATAELKDIWPHGHTVKSLVFTHSGKGYKENAFSAGADLYIGNPRNAMEIVDAIHALEKIRRKELEDRAKNVEFERDIKKARDESGMNQILKFKL